MLFGTDGADFHDLNANPTTGQWRPEAKVDIASQGVSSGCAPARFAWKDRSVDAYEVQDVTVRREEGIDIVFADGHQCSFELEELRLGCPCAGCRADRDRGKVPWPTPRSPLPLSI